MDTDKLIEEGIEKIDTILKSLGEVETYSYKTNCKFSSTNIRTLDLNSLLKVYNKIIIQEMAWERTCKELNPDDSSLELENFLISDWKSDLSYLIKRKMLEAKKDKLTEKKKKLQNLYSNEKKTLTAINDLLEGI